ncbi:protein GLE1 isoform X1 [Prunus persica]|uniref:protein GLE1 isoform X1 n=1 Tax=Prunus persica TaxID=3760 RepID=UPI0009AB5497|nr:protein GLE1 isoform X1 [Prunus persica]
MGAFKLELRCPQKVDGIALDPEPDWSFGALLSEIDELERKINSSSKVSVPFTKERPRDISDSKSNGRTSASPFVMRVFEDEMDNIDSEDEEALDQSSVAVKRFNFDDLYLSDSDDSGDDSSLEAQPCLMEKGESGESSLFELSREHQFRVKEEIRNQISALETDLKTESQKSISAIFRVERYREERCEMERKLDTQYQRNIAEALNNHLTAVQQDLEVRSQIEERKIRIDAAYEDAKRKEKALQEEKLRQERAKAEAEAKRAEEAKRGEDAKKAALEAQRRAAKEAAEREASEASKRADSGSAQEGTYRPQINALNAQSSGKPPAAGNILKAAESALNLEQGRLQKLKQFDDENQALRLRSKEDFRKYERQISKLVQQITGTKDSVRQKAGELVNIFNDARCPQSISIAAFAKKDISWRPGGANLEKLCHSPKFLFLVVSNCKTPRNAAFACGHVIVLVTSKVPTAMDLILAELHRACIYTVPKHYSQSAFESKEAYYKAIGFQEDEGKIESVDNYLARLESYMKLYGALVQTEIYGFQNVHGLKEGWAWLARFLNALPANRYTAVALNAFLHMAGYSLFKKYKSQFRKMLNIISDNFLNALRERGDSNLNPVIAEIDAYLKDNKFLREPEGRSLEGSLLSDVYVPESDYY